MEIKNKESLIVSDLSILDPDGAISQEVSKYTWKAIKYETEELSGIMLSAGNESQVPVISYAIDLNGWYAIYLCMWSGFYGEDVGISVKLSDDQAYQFVKSDNEGYNPVKFQEVFWKYADVSDQDIIFKHPEGGLPVKSNLVYLKFVPLTKCEVKQLKNDRNNQETKRLIGMNDMHGIFYGKRPTDMQPILEDIEPYLNTDFEKLYLEYWDCSRDNPKDNGQLLGHEGDVFPRKGDRYLAESKKIVKSKDIDVYEQVIKYARNNGLKVYLSQRMGNFAAEPPFENIFVSEFFRDNPYLRCIDKDGTEIARMSYAYPEVQNCVITAFEKMALYNPDGVTLLFNRGLPYLLYEDPILNGFMEEKGVDPRTLDEDNLEWLTYRADFMTGFMRKLRTKLDEIVDKYNNDKIKISVVVLANEQENLFFGLDLPVWIKEGLVDEIVPYALAYVSPGVHSSSGVDVVSIDVDYYKELVQGTNCKLYIDILPRQMSPEEYRQRALEYYDKDVDGLCFWDTNGRHVFLRQWSMIRRLGHKDQLKNWDYGKGKYYRNIKVKSLAGFRVDKYPPSWGL